MFVSIFFDVKALCRCTQDVPDSASFMDWFAGEAIRTYGGELLFTLHSSGPNIPSIQRSSHPHSRTSAM